MAFGGLEERHRVDERIVVVVVLLQHLVVIAPAVGRHFRQPFAGDGNDDARAVGRIEHGRVGIGPGRHELARGPWRLVHLVDRTDEIAGLAVEADPVGVRPEAGVVILGFGIEDLAEAAFPRPVNAGEHFLPVAAGFRHHVFQAGLFHDAQQLLELRDRHPGRHRADDVLSQLERLDRHLHVERGGREQRHRIQFGVLEELVIILVAGVCTCKPA